MSNAGRPGLQVMTRIPLVELESLGPSGSEIHLEVSKSPREFTRNLFSI